MREEMAIIRITAKTKSRILILAKNKNLKQITILEYLLNGKINIKELYEFKGKP